MKDENRLEDINNMPKPYNLNRILNDHYKQKNVYPILNESRHIRKVEVNGVEKSRYFIPIIELDQTQSFASQTSFDILDIYPDGEIERKSNTIYGIGALMDPIVASGEFFRYYIKESNIGIIVEVGNSEKVYHIVQIDNSVSYNGLYLIYSPTQYMSINNDQYESYLLP